MSFDLFLRCIPVGEPCGLPRAAVRPLFPVVEALSQVDYWVVEYDHLNKCGIAVSSAAQRDRHISSLHVERPCGDPRFWSALLSILRMGLWVLYFPGGPPIVANADAQTAFANSSMASFGEPHYVANGAEILAIVQKS